MKTIEIIKQTSEKPKKASASTTNGFKLILESTPKIMLINPNTINIFTKFFINNPIK